MKKRTLQVFSTLLFISSLLAMSANFNFFIFHIAHHMAVFLSLFLLHFTYKNPVTLGILFYVFVAYILQISTIVHYSPEHYDQLDSIGRFGFQGLNYAWSLLIWMCFLVFCEFVAFILPSVRITPDKNIKDRFQLSKFAVYYLIIIVSLIMAAIAFYLKLSIPGIIKPNYPYKIGGAIYYLIYLILPLIILVSSYRLRATSLTVAPLLFLIFVSGWLSSSKAIIVIYSLPLIIGFDGIKFNSRIIFLIIAIVAAAFLTPARNIYYQFVQLDFFEFSLALDALTYLFEREFDLRWVFSLFVDRFIGLKYFVPFWLNGCGIIEAKLKFPWHIVAIGDFQCALGVDPGVAMPDQMALGYSSDLVFKIVSLWSRSWISACIYVFSVLVLFFSVMYLWVRKKSCSRRVFLMLAILANIFFFSWQLYFGAVLCLFLWSVARRFRFG